MSSIAALKNDVSTDVTYRRQTIKLAIGTMAESLHIYLKTPLEMSGLRLLFWRIWKDSYINAAKQSLTQCNVKRRNHFEELILD